MSLSNQILVYLSEQPEDRLHSLSPADVARNMGINTEKATKLMWSLEHTGRLALTRNGRSITGVDRIIRLESKQGQHGAANGSPRRTGIKASTRPQKTPLTAAPKTVRTPLLDEYENAKARASALASSDPDNQFIEVRFRESPLAEEGLKLKAALMRMESQYSELSSQYKMTLYEYEGVKARMRERVNEKVYRDIAERQGD